LQDLADDDELVANGAKEVKLRGWFDFLKVKLTIPLSRINKDCYRPEHGVKRLPFEISSILSPCLSLAISSHLGRSVVQELDRTSPRIFERGTHYPPRMLFPGGLGPIQPPSMLSPEMFVARAQSCKAYPPLSCPVLVNSPSSV
jgi:hypothetical protein